MSDRMLGVLIGVVVVLASALVGGVSSFLPLLGPGAAVVAAMWLMKKGEVLDDAVIVVPAWPAFLLGAYLTDKFFWHYESLNFTIYLGLFCLIAWLACYWVFQRRFA